MSLPGSALTANKLVYACAMKTHRFAKFTLSLMIAVGLMTRVRIGGRDKKEYTVVNS